MQMIQNKLYLAMNAAFFIAYSGNDEVPVAGSVIVEYSNLNKRALEPVLQRLAAANIIMSVKGAKGGYYMPNPASTTLCDVAEAFINKTVPVKHEFHGFDDVIDGYLGASYKEWLRHLSDINFKQLCMQAREAGNIRIFETPVLNFAI